MTLSVLGGDSVSIWDTKTGVLEAFLAEIDGGEGRSRTVDFGSLQRVDFHGGYGVPDFGLR